MNTVIIGYGAITQSIVERGSFSAVYPAMVYDGDAAFVRDGVDIKHVACHIAQGSSSIYFSHIFCQ